MKKRKGMMLPFVIAVVVFIMFLGVVASNISLSSHKIAYANIERTQSFYLAKAGAEMGYGFLIEPIASSGQTWFDFANAHTLAELRTELNRVTNSTGGTSNGVQLLRVYYDETNPDSVPQFRAKDSSGNFAQPNSPTDKHYGDIEISIEVVGDEAQKNVAVFRVTSKGTVLGKSSANNEYTMTMEIRVLNRYDKKYF